MPRQRVEQWRQRTFRIIAAEPKLGDKAIADRLKAEDAKLGKGDYPSARTVRRIRDEYGKLQEVERRQYQLFSWPGSMGEEDLPWEASPAALELLQHYRNNGFGRPLLRLAKWYWRASLASPGMAMPDRMEIARTLAAAEVLGGVSEKEGQNIERALATSGTYEAVEGVLMPADRDEFLEVMALFAPMKEE